MRQEYQEVVIAGVGAQTALGMTAPSTAAAVRAGISFFTEHPFLFDVTGEAFVVAQANYLEIDLRGATRLVELSGSAVSETLASFSTKKTGGLMVPIFLGLPSVRPGRPQNTATRVSECVHMEMTRADLKPGKVKIFETGHSAGTMAIQAAWQTVRVGEAEFALAGGVESYLEPETMAWLEGNEQVHGADSNAWGFVPGEAAGFVLLASGRAADQLGLKTTLEMLTATTTRETKLIKTNTVCIGEGLSDLFREMASGLPPKTRTSHLICDMNGEPYRADEFGFAVIRAGDLLHSSSDFATPATCWGDVGAATGPLILMLCDMAAKKGYPPELVTGAFTSAESGERSGFVTQTRMVKQY